MNSVKTNLKFSLHYTATFIKWGITSVVVGIIGGILGSVFHSGIDYVTSLRQNNTFLIYLLPAGGVVIAGMYHMFAKKERLDTNRVIESVREGKKVPLIMMPLIFISTIITHMLGGSAGREGAALQLGGSVGYNLGRLFRLKENDMHIIIMSGMSAVFAALFGTPLTAAIFSLEVTNVGVLHYAGLFPCVISSVTAAEIAKLFGVQPVQFFNINFGTFSFDIAAKIIILAVLCALLSILFCVSIKKSERVMDKLIKNSYVRAAVGGGIIVLLTLVTGAYDYNGAGMDIISRAISGEANLEAFLLKIIFTAVTISAGFKGGEIVPSFFIGATFGCVMASLLKMSPEVAAAIGFVAVFCGVVNCPVASVILSLEIFGTDGLLYFAIACSVSYIMSGCFGLYHSQKIIYSKTDDEYIDAYTN